MWEARGRMRRVEEERRLGNKGEGEGGRGDEGGVGENWEEEGMREEKDGDGKG